jgi:serine/threonine protein kinase
LTDFGLSKEGIYDNISANSFCGSLAYLAPEMLANNGHGKSVDWYLLGVLLYEMIVGKTPYYSTNKEQLLDNIENGDLFLPRGMSNQAKSIVLQLMDRDPCSRLGSSARDAEVIKEHPFF